MLERMQIAMAVAEFYQSQLGQALLWTNSIAALVMKWVLQAAYVYLMCFYTQLGPVAAVALILPATRRIFSGYVLVYLGLCLWPAFFSLCERIIQALPGVLLASGIDATSSSDAYSLGVIVSQGVLVLGLMNIMFVFAYLSVPVATVAFVTAAGRPFRSR
jgi:hypothetical protein